MVLNHTPCVHALSSLELLTGYRPCSTQNGSRLGPGLETVLGKRLDTISTLREAVPIDPRFMLMVRVTKEGQVHQPIWMLVTVNLCWLSLLSGWW